MNVRDEIFRRSEEKKDWTKAKKEWKLDRVSICDSGRCVCGEELLWEFMIMNSRTGKMFCLGMCCMLSFEELLEEVQKRQVSLGAKLIPEKNPKKREASPDDGSDYTAMIKAVEYKRNLLTGWEMGFLDSISTQYGKRKKLSEKQANRLNELYAKVTD